MKTFSFYFLLITAVPGMSCMKERIDANRNTISETRTLRAFTGVNLSGSKRINISYGAECKVELKGSSNLISRYNTRIINNTLTMGYENGIKVVDDDVRVYITLPEIEEVNISGSGKVSISGAFQDQDRLKVRISGSGDVTAEDSFELNKIDADISGSGEANLEAIQAREANVNISGSGTARISAKNNLKARISGSGKVYYWGSPIVDSRVSGSGKVISNN